MKRKEGRRLVKVPHVASAAHVLWELMLEKEPHEAISQTEMPSWEDHVEFVLRFPFRMWYLIEADGEFVGCISLSRRNEIGLRLFRAHQRKGHGSWAVREIVRMWTKTVARSGRPAVQRAAFIANINPANAASLKLFESLGFSHVQATYALDVKE